MPIRDKAMLDFLKTKAKSCHREDVTERGERFCFGCPGETRRRIRAWFDTNGPVWLKLADYETS